MRTNKHRFARRMRFRPTAPEAALHNALTRAFEPYDTLVQVQAVIGPYIADFLIKHLVIEVDGIEHNRRQEYDARRTRYLNNRGFRVVRYTNADVLENAERCANELVALTAPHLPARTMGSVKITRCPPASAIHGKKPLKRPEFVTVW